MGHSGNPVFITQILQDRETVIHLLINFVRVIDFDSVEEEALC